MDSTIKQLFSESSLFKQASFFEITKHGEVTWIKRDSDKEKIVLFSSDKYSGHLSVGCKIDITEELSGENSDNKIIISIVFSGENGNIIFQENSDTVPNIIGIWELSLTANAPVGAKSVNVFLKLPVEHTSIGLRDICITETDGIAVPFGKVFPELYTEKKEETVIREYKMNLLLGDNELINFLEYCVAHNYKYDLKVVNDLIAKDGHRLIYDLFVLNEINYDKENFASIINALSSGVVEKILEKLVLNKKMSFFSFLINTLDNEKLNNDIYGNVLRMSALCYEKKSDLARELYKKTDRIDIINDKSELSAIICPGNGREAQRMFTLKWLADNLTEIRRRALLYEKKNKKIDNHTMPVFVFWAQGIDAAPVIVKKCIDRMKEMYGERLKIITADTMADYADIPMISGIDKWAHKSDIFRLELLMRYGGTWLDSTVFVNDGFKELQNSQSFIFPLYPPHNKQLGNWLLSVNEQYNYFYCLLFSALNMYLDLYKDYNEYFMFHTFVKSLVHLDKRAGDFFSSVYPLDAGKATFFVKKRGLTNYIDDFEFEKAFKGSIVHKLSYKYDETNNDHDSVISRLIRMEKKGAVMEIVEKDKCYGCNACLNICPTQAISMEEDNEGFLFPVIDEKKCISCNRCKDVCPSLHPQYDNSENPDVYGFQAGSEFVTKGSSGGAFPVLAESVINEGGIVFGAVFDNDWSVVHKAAEDYGQLKELAFSKYLQSDVKTTYKEAGKALEEGRTVLYTACPCQIAALKSYLGKEYDNLITVDLICHGVPSPGIFKKYLEENFDTEKIINIEFRTGKRWHPILGIDFSDGSREEYNTKNNLYYRAFLKNYALRMTCYSCIFNRIPRQGDITIGDLWGASKMNLEIPSDKTSVVLCNNEKGKTFFLKALVFNKEYNHIQSLSLKYPKPNRVIFESSADNSKLMDRRSFFEIYAKYGFNKAAYGMTSDFKTGLLLYLSSNYDSMTSNLSLYDFLQRSNRKPVYCDNLVKPRGKYAPLFAKKYLKCASDYYREDDCEELNKHIDTYVVGSDMTWNLKTPGMKKHPEYMLLGFAGDDKLKIAYTPSFGGGGRKISEYKKIICSYFMKRFDKIAVREKEGQDMCRELFDCDVEVGWDPLFLSEADFFKTIAEDKSDYKDEKYVVAYILNPTDDKIKIINDVAKLKDLNVYLVLDLEADHEANKEKTGNLKDRVVFPDFATWVSLFVNAEQIVTDSYHGVCLSLVLEKSFIGIKNRAKYRFDQLCTKLPVQERIIDSPSECDVEKILNNIILDNDAVKEGLSEIRKTSEEWWEQAFSIEKESCNNEELYRLSMSYIELLRNISE